MKKLVLGLLILISYYSYSSSKIIFPPGNFNCSPQFSILHNSPLKDYKIQRRWGPDILFGFESGINISDLKQASSTEPKMKVGFKAGSYIRLIYDETLSIQSGVYYSNKGYKLESDYIQTDGSKITDKFSMNYNYIDIPFLLRLSFGERYKINFEPGLYSSLLVSAKQNGTKTIEYDGMEPVVGNVNIDATENYRLIDFGLTLGVGIEYPLTFNKRGLNYSTFLKAAYDWGLTNVSNTDLATIKNRNIYIGAGFSILLD